MSPSVISLPGGPGAIEGLGASFEPQLNTGTATYGVSITVPPGVAGHAPGVDLSYNSGNGNGLLGIGWSLDLPTIKRQLDKGLPDYTGPAAPAPTEDVFLYNGEELVPLSDGTYRCENETEFVRLRKIASQPNGLVDAWQADLPDGRTMVFGRTPAERVTRAGGDPALFADTYCWSISTFTDTSGNEIRYEYETFAPDSMGMLYPRRIEYARFGEDIHHRVEFIYSGSATYPFGRTDVFSDFRAGFEVRTSRLLCEVAVLTDGSLVRRYVLGYDPDPVLTPPMDGEIDLGFSLLQRVTQLDRSGDDNNYLPPLTFAYSRFAAPQSAPFVPVTGGQNFLRFGAPLTEVIDINADGLPDFISSFLGSWYAYLNRGGGFFSDEVPFTAEASDGTDQANGKRLDQPYITLADLDGDGITDLFQKAAISERILMHRNLNDFRAPSTLDANEVVRWGPEIEFSSELQAGEFGTLDISDPSIRMLDLNFDKRTDAMRPFDFGNGTGGIEYILNTPDGWRSELIFEPDARLPVDWTPDEARFEAQNGALRINGLADMNGDRLVDWYTLAIVGDQVWIDYWPNANGGFWGERQTTQRIDIPGTRADEFRLMDVNTDGVNDLVRVRHFELTYWINTGGEEWSEPMVRVDAPAYIEGRTVLRALDVNANGTTDLFWDNSMLDSGTLPEGAPLYVYFDFVGDLKPNLLTAIDNGVGLRTHIHYKSSIDDYLAGLAEGQPWTTKLPFPLVVVARTVESVGLDLNLDGQPDEYITDFTYRDGFYDSFEKEFRGFAFVEQIERGDDYDPETGVTHAATESVSGPSLVSRYRYLTGAPDGVDNDDYPPGYSGWKAVDEGTGTGNSIVSFTDDRGGREEEPLKGFTVLEEAIDPAVLNAPADAGARFHQGARAAALAAQLDPSDPAALRCTPDRYVYSRSRTDWKVRRLYRPATVSNPPGRFGDGAEPSSITSLVEKSVSFAYSIRTESEVIEANEVLRDRFDGEPVTYPQRLPKVTRSEMDYDDFGNLIVSADYGLTEVGDPSAYDDEQITRLTYAREPSALARWFVRFPVQERVEDEQGRFVSESRYYYDGEELVGLPLGAVGDRGLVKRTESVVTDDPTLLLELEAYDPERLDQPGDPRGGAGSFVVTSRTAHDRFGNALVMMDPLGDPGDVQLHPNPTAPEIASAGASNRGHFRIIGYDPLRHVYPVSETVVIGENHAPLTMAAVYDPGFGVVTEASDWNNNWTHYHYDSFARLVKTVRPGDVEQRPTLRFSYQPADPQRGVVYTYSDTGELLDGKPVAVSGPAASAVWTFVREDRPEAGEYNTFDSVRYSSGSGALLMSISEDEEPGRWVVIEAPSFNLRGSTLAELMPYYRTNQWYHRPGMGGFDIDGQPVAESDQVERGYDALGRLIRVLNPPEQASGRRSFAMTQHLPFEERDFDPEDTDSASAHFDTPIAYYSDGLGRRIRVEEIVRLDDLGSATPERRVWETLFDYDLNGNLVWLRDSQANVRWARFDGLGRQIFRNDPNRGTRLLHYDDGGNVREALDAKGQRNTYTYDGLNRILTEDYHDESAPYGQQRVYDPALPISEVNRPEVLYAYDDWPSDLPTHHSASEPPTHTRGLLVRVLDLAGEFILSYDERGRSKWQTRCIADPVTGQFVPYRTEVSYDAADRVLTTRYPDGDRVHYEYNRRSLTERIRGQAASVEQVEPVIVGQVDYFPSGKIARRELGDGTVTQITLDRRLRAQRLVVTSPAEENRPLLDLAYAYDSVGNVLDIEDRRTAPAAAASGVMIRNAQSFEYDDLYRLTRAAYPSATTPDSEPYLEYRYDRLGNLVLANATLSHSENGRSLTQLGVMHYGGDEGASGRIGRTSGGPGPHALTQTDSGEALSYDANGNVTASNGRQFYWDFLDRLVAVEDERQLTVYTHDFLNRRIIRRQFEREADGPFSAEPQSWTLYPSRGFEIRDGERTVKYVWQDEERVAEMVGTLDAGATRVQRLRVQTGWNVFVVAVSSEDGAGQVFGSEKPEISQVVRWDPALGVYQKLNENAAVSQGDLLWVYAVESGVLELGGTYVEVEDSVALPEGKYGGNASLQPYQFGQQSSELPPATLWQFTEELQRWQAQNVGLESPSGITLAAGESVFVSGSDNATANLPPLDRRTHYYHGDHLESANLVTDGSGAVVTEAVYYPFGGERERFVRPDSTRWASPLAYGYCQKEQDEESGWIHFEARQLMPVLGRFSRPDPLTDEQPSLASVDPQLLNAYAYCANNPINATDPDGEIGVFTVLGSGIGFVTGAGGAAVKTYIKNRNLSAGSKLGFKGQMWAGAKSGAIGGAISGAALDVAVYTAASGGAAMGVAVAGAAAGGGVSGFYGNKWGQVAAGVTKPDIRAARRAAAFGLVGGAVGGLLGPMAGGAVGSAASSGLAGGVVAGQVASAGAKLITAVGREGAEFAYNKARPLSTRSAASTVLPRVGPGTTLAQLAGPKGVATAQLNLHLAKNVSSQVRQAGERAQLKRHIARTTPKSVRRAGQSAQARRGK